MGEKKTLGILLKKTFLPNDDAVLEFLKMEMGKITIFAKNFIKSKKRNEIDFFRVIELVIFQGRNSKTLKKATTFSVFHNFSRDFSSSRIGFAWLDLLRNIIPEEEVNHNLFKKIIDLFANYSGQKKEQWDAYFQVQMLNFAGFWPKFDSIRDNLYFNPLTKKNSREISAESIFIPNLDRQILEFLRRADLDEFSTKINNLPENFSKVLEVITSVRDYK